MTIALDPEKVRVLAKQLDDALEKKDIEEVVAYFSTACEIRLPGRTLTGHRGLRKAIDWMYSFLKEIRLVPVTILIKDDTFFEEFTVRSRIDERDVELNQAEVLVYDEQYRVKSLRLYFDRLELAEHLPANFIDRMLVRRVGKESLKGLDD